MKLLITGTGEDLEDDKLVNFTLTAETETYKTTLQFYGLADEFKDFAAALKKFPFEKKDDVKYEQGYWENSPSTLRVNVRLADAAGRIVLRVETNDKVNNESAEFEDSVEASPLERLSKKLESTDFSKKAGLVWDSKSSL